MISALALLTCPAWLQAAGELHPFSHQFSASSSGFPFSIRTQRTLTRDSNGLWRLEVSASNWLGEIRESTAFEWKGCDASTRRYGYIRKGLGREKQALIKVADDKRASGNRNGKPVSYDVPDNTADKLSHVLSLQCKLARGDADLSVDVADERGVEQFHYQRTGEEWLETAAGRLLAVRVERQRDDDSGRQTVLWFSPSHDYNLVRLLQVEDGDHHELNIQKF